MMLSRGFGFGTGPMFHRSGASALALAFLLLLATAARADAIDRYLARQQSVYGVPAIVVGVIRDGKLVEQRARGLANVELGVKATPRHVFEIGSISKQFTAYAILILAEEGKVALDAPLGTYLDDIPDAWKSVTLHRLLTHTSGIPDLEEAFGYGVYRETPTDTAFIVRLAALPIDFPPGDRWKYSNTNYWLLARVIERSSATTYSDFMQRRIFTPLGMSATRTAEPPRILPQRAAGYQRVNKVLENRDAIQPSTGRGLGDIATTIADLARWEREQLSPRLVTRASAELARTPVRLNDGKEAPYAYGWFTDPILPRVALYHDGQTAGFTAGYVRVPELRLAVVVLANLYGGPADRIARYVARRSDPALRQAPLPPIADNDSASTQRVRLLLATGLRAPTEWKPEWFTKDFWAEYQPYLADIANAYEDRGTIRGVALVERVADGTGGQTSKYRVAHTGWSRILTVKLDAEGRISSFNGEDE